MSQIEKNDAHFRMEQFRNGNDKALAYFFDQHHKALFYFTRNLVQDEAQAEEIVSDCYMKLWERRSDFETDQNIKAFLFISSRNASFNYIKYLKRRTAAQQQYYSQFEEGEETILFEYIETEVLEMLEQEIETLPGKCREVFKQIYFEGRKTDDIARDMDLSVQTVRNHKTRAIELIRSSFLKKGISEAMTMVILVHLAGK